MNIKSIENIKTPLFVSFFFVSTLLLFGPSQLYLTNEAEFSFRYSELLPILITVSVVAFLSITVILVILSNKRSIYDKAVSFLFTLSILLWFQGNILIWNYGLLDGKEIQWNKHIVKGIVDTVIWLSVVIICIWKSSFFSRIAQKLSFLFITIQLIAITVTLYPICYRGTEVPSFQKYSIDETNKFLFSKEKNVIILVLDTFQTDVFQEIINEDKRYKDIFDGFTYFRNAAGGFAKTYASVPLILTGKYYDNSIPIQEFIKKEYSQNSIPKVLKDNGYQVDIFPYISKTIYFDPVIMSNLRKKGSVPGNLSEIGRLYDITLFRYMPHFVKRYVYNGQKWRLTQLLQTKSNDKKVTNDKSSSKLNDIQFIDTMTSNSVIRESAYIFKYYHLNGVHLPLLLNESLELERMPLNRNNFKRQAKASLKIVEIFLNKLKKIGAFDNSLIFVLGDHGAGEYDIGVNVKINGYHETTITPDPTIQTVKQAGIPLVLVKKIDSSGKMNISDAPVSLSDIPTTLANEIGIKGDFPGKSMFGIKEGESRERRFMYYQHDTFQSDYLQPISEYVVSGFSWLYGSWKATGNVFIPKQPKNYANGTLIKFGNGENYLQYAGKGWGYRERGFTWTEGEKAELLIPYMPSKDDVILIANIAPFLADGALTQQRINISVNDNRIGSWVVSRDGEYKMVIPKDHIRDLMEINFELPDAISTQSNDKRNPGVAFKTVRLVQIYQLGTEIDFGENGNGRQYQTSGWGFAETDFTWTNEKTASLTLPIKETDSDLIFTAYLRPFLPAGKITQQRVKITVNGSHIGNWTINKKESQKQSVVIPHRLISDGILNITFELPDAISPVELGTSKDIRVLGLAVKSVAIDE